MLRESSLNAAAIVFLSMGRRCKWKRMVLLAHNYVKLRDIGKAVGFEVFWDSDNELCAGRKPACPYTGEAPAKAEPDKPESHPEPTAPANDADVGAMKQDLDDQHTPEGLQP